MVMNIRANETEEEQWNPKNRKSQRHAFNSTRISINAANQKRVNVYFFAFYLFFGNMENDLLIRFRHNINTHTQTHI